MLEVFFYLHCERKVKILKVKLEMYVKNKVSLKNKISSQSCHTVV